MLQEDLIDFSESVSSRLLQAAEKNSKNIAIKINKQCYSYEVLFDKAKAVAVLLRNSKEKFCLILSRKNIVCYVGLLAVLLAGKAYIFLNTQDSIEEIMTTISWINSKLLLSDMLNSLNIFQLEEMSLNKYEYIVLNEIGQVHDALFSSGKNISLNSAVYHPDMQVYRYAYLMFTSGSTGEPKGIPVSHKNLRAFLTNIIGRVKPVGTDNFSQFNELTFDFSVYEIFVCWLSGACLCVLSDNHLLRIEQYIVNNNITHWSSVPSVVNLLEKMGKLKANVFPGIRYSVFCGEVLTPIVAKLWKIAASNTLIDNLYGPTEATVAISGSLWDAQYEQSIVPIGLLFQQQTFYLLNDQEKEVRTGEIGELYLAGSQIVDCYWRNPQLTQKHFISFNGRRVYKTGDLACIDEKYGLIYKGRIDDQLKLNGYRIEKIDIENRIKVLLNTEAVVIVAKKSNVTTKVLLLCCFFSGVRIDALCAHQLCRESLPDYMMPNHFIYIEQLPYNKNGKIDYQALMNLLESQICPR